MPEIVLMMIIMLVIGGPLLCIYVGIRMLLRIRSQQSPEYKRVLLAVTLNLLEPQLNLTIGMMVLFFIFRFVQSGTMLRDTAIFMLFVLALVPVPAFVLWFHMAGRRHTTYSALYTESIHLLKWRAGLALLMWLQTVLFVWLLPTVLTLTVPVIGFVLIGVTWYSFVWGNKQQKTTLSAPLETAPE